MRVARDPSAKERRKVSVDRPMAKRSTPAKIAASDIHVLRDRCRHRLHTYSPESPSPTGRSATQRPKIREHQLLLYSY